MDETVENSLVYSDNELQINLSLDKSAKKKGPLWFDKHAPDNARLKKKFVLILVITCLFGLLQLMLSVFSGSLSLLGDSFHQIIDTLSVLVCLLALKYSLRKSNEQYTYGYHRLEVVGAIVCNVILIVIMVLLVQESVLRILTIAKPDYQPKIVGKIMIVGACIGIICDFFLIFTLKSSKEIVSFYKDHDKCCQ